MLRAALQHRDVRHIHHAGAAMLSPSPMICLCSACIHRPPSHTSRRDHRRHGSLQPDARTPIAPFCGSGVLHTSVVHAGPPESPEPQTRATLPGGSGRAAKHSRCHLTVDRHAAAVVALDGRRLDRDLSLDAVAGASLHHLLPRRWQVDAASGARAGGRQPRPRRVSRVPHPRLSTAGVCAHRRAAVLGQQLRRQLPDHAARAVRGGGQRPAAQG
eukprot:ctg_511.g290